MLKPDSRAFLLAVMARCRTGADRIPAGVPAGHAGGAQDRHAARRSATTSGSSPCPAGAGSRSRCSPAGSPRGRRGPRSSPTRPAPVDAAWRALMQLHIIARGKIGRSPEAELVERYLKRIAWPTKVTELPDRGGTDPRRAAGQRHHPARRARRRCCRRSSSPRKLEGWRDGGKREARFLIGAADGHDAGASGERRPDPVVRPRDLAAHAGAGDAGRAIVPRHIDPCEPPLSSRRMSAMKRALLLTLMLAPLLAASSSARPAVAAVGHRQACAPRRPRPKPRRSDCRPPPARRAARRRGSPPTGSPPPPRSPPPKRGSARWMPTLRRATRWSAPMHARLAAEAGARRGAGRRAGQSWPPPAVGQPGRRSRPDRDGADARPARCRGAADSRQQRRFVGRTRRQPRACRRCARPRGGRSPTRARRAGQAPAAICRARSALARPRRRARRRRARRRRPHARRQRRRRERSAINGSASAPARRLARELAALARRAAPPVRARARRASAAARLSRCRSRRR